MHIYEVLIVRATLNIPDDLLEEVQNISGEKSKTKAITIAMKEFVRQIKIKELISLRGKIKIEYDWEKEEEIEMEAQKNREKLLEKQGAR
jgi:metal-responsive CopG/Arc/MetJ family transcriptional regulator